MATVPDMNVSGLVFINRHFTGALAVYRYSGGRVSAERLSDPSGAFLPIDWSAYPVGIVRTFSDGSAEMDDAQFARFLDLLRAWGWSQVFPKPAS